MIKKLYYLLTAYLPRPIPKTEEEYQAFKKILVTYYGVTDEPKTWMTVAGVLTSTPSEKLRRPWGKIANCAKRLDMNKLAHDHKMAATQKLNKMLEEAFMIEQELIKKEADDEKAKEVQPKENGQPDQPKETQGQDQALPYAAPIEEIGIGHENPYV